MRLAYAAPFCLSWRLFDGLLLQLALHCSKGKFILLIAKKILCRPPFICIQA